MTIKAGPTQYGFYAVADHRGSPLDRKVIIIRLEYKGLVFGDCVVLS